MEVQVGPVRTRWCLMTWETVFPGLGFWLSGMRLGGVLVAAFVYALAGVFFLVKDPQIPLWVGAVGLGGAVFLMVSRFLILYLVLPPTAESIPEGLDPVWRGAFFNLFLPARPR